MNKIIKKGVVVSVTKSTKTCIVKMRFKIGFQIVGIGKLLSRFMGAPSLIRWYQATGKGELCCSGPPA